MLGIRPYKPADADTILSWCKEEKAFYQWTAGVLGEYPISQNEFRFVESLMPFTAFDETGVIGFFTLRSPDETANELRFGFVTVKPAGENIFFQLLLRKFKHTFGGVMFFKKYFRNFIYPLVRALCG